MVTALVPLGAASGQVQITNAKLSTYKWEKQYSHRMELLLLEDCLSVAGALACFLFAVLTFLRNPPSRSLAIQYIRLSQMISTAPLPERCLLRSKSIFGSVPSSANFFLGKAFLDAARTLFKL